MLDKNKGLQGQKLGKWSRDQRGKQAESKCRPLRAEKGLTCCLKTLPLKKKRNPT